jgi:O-antigen/teichoic acid export membrane protein
MTFAQRVFRLLSDIASGALSSVVHVVLASMQAEADRVRNAFLMVSFVACAIGFPIFAGAALVIDDLITLLFGATWAEAGQAARIFCLAGFLTTIGIVQGALIRSQGHADRWFWYQLLQQATTVALLALTWSYGVSAMAAAVVAKSYLFWPISARMTIRQLGLGLPAYMASLRGPALSAAGMAAAVLALPAVPGWSGLALQVAVGATVYAILLTALDRRRIVATVRVLRHRKGPVT